MKKTDLEKLQEELEKKKRYKKPKMKVSGRGVFRLKKAIDKKSAQR